MFNLQDEIRKLEDSPRRDLNIIGLLFSERKPNLKTKEQYQIALKQHLRPAKDLIPFDDGQILEAMRQAKEFVPGWNLNTLIKLLIK